MFIDVNGAKIHFSSSGSSVPTLFLHGIPDSGMVWNTVIAALEKGYRCVAPDLPGFGLSGIPRGFTISLEDMADFIDAFIAALGITEPINLIVHDIGGPYGLAWAVRHPDKVRSIAIMNTVFQSEYRWHRYGRICRMPVLGELLQILTSQSGLARAIRSNSGLKKPGRAHIAATYRGFKASVRRMVLRLYRGLDPRVLEGWDEQLRAMSASIPSLVIWGDRDTYIPGLFADRFGARQVMHLPDCGHWPMIETPDVIARRLSGLFSRAIDESQPESYSWSTTIPIRSSALRTTIGDIDPIQ